MNVEKAHPFSSLDEGLAALRPTGPAGLNEDFLHTFFDISHTFRPEIAERYQGRRPEDDISFQSALSGIVIGDWIVNQIIPLNVQDWEVKVLLENAMSSYRSSQQPNLTPEDRSRAVLYRQTRFQKIALMLFGEPRQ